MTVDGWDSWTRGWRGPLYAALLALAAGAPGAFTLPALDRDESRFAQATTQMLETGDFININFQDEPRHKKPVGIHWLQAASVGLTTEPETRAIWAYRIPSLLGAMLAAAACAWGAKAFFGSGMGFAAGAVLGVSVLLSTEAFFAKTDAVLCGAVTLAMAALGRIYAASRVGGELRRSTVALFWAGMAGAILIKGPVGPMIAGLAMLTLWAWDREIRWARDLQWWWGLVACLLVFGPWAFAITIATDGAFWASSIGGDLAPKLNSGDEGHAGFPGYHLLVAPLALFPATLLLPAALVLAWRKRAEPGVRFAVAWVVPSWILFELLPTKLPHYPLPLYAGLAWLLAAALAEPKGRWIRAAGAALSILVGLVFAAVGLYAVSLYGDRGDATWAAIAAGLFAAAGLAGAIALLERASRTALAVAGVLAFLAHGVLFGGLAPRLEPLWLSDRTAKALARAGLHPREAAAPGPVAVAGYAEPSLVFALGAATGLGGAEEAAEALAQGRAAVIEGRELPAFGAALAERGLGARQVARVEGLNYSKGDETELYVFGPEAPQ